MEIMMLHGSARGKGNTAKIVGWMRDELVALGHELHETQLYTQEIKACLACGQCKQVADQIACVQQDDASKLLLQMVAADLVVFTSPLYFWGLAGPLKSLIDRTYSLYVDYHKPGHSSLIEGQRQALLVTGAGPYENNAEGVFFAFSKLQGPHKTVNAGELYVGNCTTPDAMDAKTKEQAIAFARKIVGKL